MVGKSDEDLFLWGNGATRVAVWLKGGYFERVQGNHYGNQNLDRDVAEGGNIIV